MYGLLYGFIFLIAGSFFGYFLSVKYFFRLFKVTDVDEWKRSVLFRDELLEFISGPGSHSVIFSVWSKYYGHKEPGGYVH